MTSQKSLGGFCDAEVSFVETEKRRPSVLSEKSQLPQARAGVSRRLIGGRWVSPSPSTAMASALVKAARAANAEKSQKRQIAAHVENHLHQRPRRRQ